MLRLTPPDKDRIALSDSFSKTAGGSELNVCCGASALGLRSGIITALPDNALGQFVKNRIRFAGVSDDHLLLSNEPNARLGVYYYEMGAYPRQVLGALRPGGLQLHPSALGGHPRLSFRQDARLPRQRHHPRPRRGSPPHHAGADPPL